ncbi:hypothetical protein ACVWYN_000059 [Pedobacter sp. UYP24]
MLRNVLFILLILSNVCLGQSKSIILSSRWFHPFNKQDTLNTLSVFKNLRVDRIDWMYCDNIQQIQALKNDGVKFSLAINPQVPDSLGFTTVKTRMLDLNGRPYVAPWMSNWKANNLYWGCVNNPSFQNLFIIKSMQIVDFGAYGIFVDDARFNDSAVEWGGGCYCEYCLKKFSEFLAGKKIVIKKDFNYKNYLKNIGAKEDVYKKLYGEFQTESVISFLTNWKKEVYSYSGKKLKFLTNNAGGKWNNIYSIFDMGIAELDPRRSDFRQLSSSISLARSLGKEQVFSYASSNQSCNLSYYLYCYLNKSEALIPWDLWLNDKIDHHKRLYSDSSTIRDVISFIIKYKNDFSKEVTQDTLFPTNGIADYVQAIKCQDGKEFLVFLNSEPNKLINVDSFAKAYKPIITGVKLKNSYNGFVILEKLK